MRDRWPLWWAVAWVIVVVFLLTMLYFAGGEVS
jgi:hypothetical protein